MVVGSNPTVGFLSELTWKSWSGLLPINFLKIGVTLSHRMRLCWCVDLRNSGIDWSGCQRQPHKLYNVGSNPTPVTTIRMWLNSRAPYCFNMTVAGSSPAIRTTSLFLRLNVVWIHILTFGSCNTIDTNTSDWHTEDWYVKSMSMI